MGEPILQAKDLEMTYGKHKVLQKVSLSLLPGEILGVAGANGAGKSTLLTLLAGIKKPHNGAVLFEGTDIHKIKKQYCMQLGYVPQEIALFEELTGKDNLMFFGKACRVPAKEMADRIREVCEITEFPEEELNRPVSEYSGGMKRKINIGAAVLHHPRVLLLDEPVANLDKWSEEQVLTALRRLADQGVAIVYVGHQLEKMEQLCNQISFMENGKVVSGKEWHYSA